MPCVTFYPTQATVWVNEGTTVIEAARLAGVELETPCNGSGVCRKCRVRVAPLNHLPGEVRQKLFPGEEPVLACQTEIIGDISVEIPAGKKTGIFDILSHGKCFEVELNGLIRKEYRPDKVTRVMAGHEILGEEGGDTTRELYGAVVDIGTTTLVVSVVDLASGEEAGSASAINPQAVHAQDVLSRIHFASKQQGLDVLHSALIQEINRMIIEAAGKGKVKPDNIYEIVFSGNTCMLHLAAGTDPGSLGRYPYQPVLWGGNHLKATDLGLKVCKFGLVYLPPVISAYVGADITSGMLATGMHRREGVALFVDIGTNGEMVLATKGRLSATSTAAGPAFEGMNINHGMKAGRGAIEGFQVTESGRVEVRTVGDSRAVGICGSGLVDIVGECVAHGVINKRGKLVDPGTNGLHSALRDRLEPREGKIAFRVAEDVFLLQGDIRQVQLAKGAVRAGIEFLLRHHGIGPSDVDEVLIAGSFGFHLRAESLIRIGLLPKEFRGRISFVGNTSKSGGRAFLLNQEHREEMSRLVKAVQVLDLSQFDEFQRTFVSCLAF